MRLIDANELMGRIIECCRALVTPDKTLGFFGLFVKDIQQIIDDTPTINPEDCRPSGWWIETNWAEYDGHGEVITYYDVKALKCSKCCHCFKEELLWRKNYCPNCGARMNGKE